MLESLEPLWTYAQILKCIKLAIGEDATLEPILAFFKNGSDRAPMDIQQ